MKRVLIITYYWPPMGGGGVQRWVKTTKYLREYGWEPIIYTTENGEIAIQDNEMLKEIPDGVETIRTKIWEPFGLYKKLLGKKKDEALLPGMSQSSEGNSLLQNLSLWVRGNIFIPDARKFWIKPSSKFLINYLKENKVDAIISTGPPHSTHLIAKNVVQKHKIPWLADFRDPWTLIDFYHKLKLSNWADKKHKRLEQEVLHTANEVTTVSWSCASDFEEISGKLPIVITNGYDPADFTTVENIVLDKKFTLTHTGSLNEDRNPHALWRVLAELTEEDVQFKNDLEIKFIGQVAAEVIQSINQHQLQNNLNLVGNLPHNQVISQMISSQLLLALLNNTPKNDGIIPGKLFEYLGAQRPIVAIGKPEGDAAKVIKETQAGTLTGFDEVNALKEIIKNHYTAYKSNSLKVNSKGYEKFSRKILAKSFADELNKISAKQ